MLSFLMVSTFMVLWRQSVPVSLFKNCHCSIFRVWGHPFWWRQPFGYCHVIVSLLQNCSFPTTYYPDLVSKRLFWEMLKMEIRAVTISFSRKIAKSAYCSEMEIRRQLHVSDDIICNNFHSSIYDRNGLAAIFRSKCRWIEKGERPTKYFFNHEKKNYIKKNYNGAPNGGWNNH